MNKKFKVFIITLAVAVLVGGFYSIGHLIFIQYNGSQITATVQLVDTDCDKYNEIDVVFENNTYSVSISRSNCQKKVYKVGQQVTLLKYKNDDTLIWPESQYQWQPFILIAVFALAYYSNKDKFVKSQKSTRLTERLKNSGRSTKLNYKHKSTTKQK